MGLVVGSQTATQNTEKSHASFGLKINECQERHRSLSSAQKFATRRPKPSVQTADLCALTVPVLSHNISSSLFLYSTETTAVAAGINYWTLTVMRGVSLTLATAVVPAAIPLWLTGMPVPSRPVAARAPFTPPGRPASIKTFPFAAIFFLPLPLSQAPKEHESPSVPGGAAFLTRIRVSRDVFPPNPSSPAMPF